MGHYLYNVFLMVFPITSVTALVWAIETAEVADRIATDVALLLTAQAFKLVISDKLPKVNYLTIIDKYIFVCFFFMLNGAVMHAAVAWHADEGHWQTNLDT